MIHNKSSRTICKQVRYTRFREAEVREEALREGGHKKTIET
jgi:hypothetical protein